MRCLITTGIYPPDIGGPASFVASLAGALRRRGIPARILTWADPPLRQEPDVRRVSRRSPLPLREFRTLLALYQELNDCDVAFINGLLRETTLAHLPRPRPLVVKIVGDEVWDVARNRGWTHLGIEAFQEWSGDFRVRLLRHLRRLGLLRSRVIVTPSAFTARLVRGWVGKGGPPIRVLPNIPAMPALLPNVGPLPWPKGTVRVVSVGRLIELKRFDLLIQGLVPVPGLHLVIVGDGPARAPLEALVDRLGVSHRVSFLGARPHEETLSIMAHAHIFALGSSSENAPQALLEGMALGLAVVVPAVGGIPEIVEHGVTGLTYPPSDTHALTESLRVLVHEDQRAALGQAARGTYGPDVWENVVESWIRILREASTGQG